MNCKKCGKRIFSVLLAVAMVFACTPVSVDAAKKPKLNKTSVTLRVGRKTTLRVKNTKKKVKWSVQSGKKYITLKNKKKTSVVVQAKRAGTAKVAAKVSGKKMVCRIKVKKNSAGAANKSYEEDDSASDSTSDQSSNPTATKEPATQDNTETKIKCPACNGGGMVKCTFCDWGFITCTHCGGRGTTYDIYSGRYKVCIYCTGGGHASCTSCAGKGAKFCMKCGGTGRISSTL